MVNFRNRAVPVPCCWFFVYHRVKAGLGELAALCLVSRVEVEAGGGIWVCATSWLLLLAHALLAEVKQSLPENLLVVAFSELSVLVPFLLINLLYFSCKAKGLHFFWYFEDKQ